MKPEVTVVLPTRNEERAISIMLPRIRGVLERLEVPYEIIVVDKSVDKTPEIAEQLGAKVIKQEGIGYGDAYLTGFKHADGKFIIMMDPDGSYDPEDIPNILKPLLEGEADFVIGTRLRGKMDRGAMPWLHKYIGNPLLTKILNILFKAGISDAHCGMRAIRKDVLDQLPLKCRGMEFASEMVIEAAKKNLRIVEVPIRYHQRIGKSKLSSFKDGWRHLRLMLLYSPSHLFLFPGILLLGMGLLLMGYTYFINPERLHTMILGSALTLLSVQILSFGISAKVYAAKEGLDEPTRLTNFFMRYSILEEGLLVGGIMFIIGIMLGVHIFLQWQNAGYGALFKLKEAILVLTFTTIGIQVMFFAFFVSIYLLKGDD
ncbi:glycosyltransferase family 2 protein [Thermococcus sp. GR7]|uniref:glycosyltransferase family 2 protein n=1 Tax=unclassified Thermococcus TaxID=2627626 RepID=UPI0014315FF1|nr:MULTISPECIES: glycosyltransferase family 2 protein [unclassified Thermococcus]NJE45941.1 glycosyltransferase family 2 protein [Thermococcus sp. GR7]NJE78832.1 glycosyltransferase family 2 protein [Thermococcus sp. GR4]NJF22137.1 glycosyltransferase family 2 protein [Thermococcus sp. GR5]